MTTTLFFLFLVDVHGVVLDPSARPVPEAEVVCASERVATNERGEFSFSASGCEAEVAKAGFVKATVLIDSSNDNRITLALAPASDRVVVSATGAPVALEEAGVAADVITAKDFAERQYPPVEDLLRDLAGLDVVQTGQNGGITSLFARGGESDTALVLLDGVPVTEPGGALDFIHLSSAGLDRIEVIRGPESALFGAEASSAVIQMFTSRGDPETKTPHGSISYERGSFSTDRWIASLTGGLAGRIDYSLTADQFRTTGEFPNDAYRITTGTASLGYHFSDRTSLRGVYRTFDSYTGVPGQAAYGLIDYGATEVARDSVVGVHLDDARGRHFVQRIAFGYHRYRDSFVDQGTGGPYQLAALLQTVPAKPVPLVYLVRLVDPSTTVAPPGTTLVNETVQLFPGSGLTVTDRTDASYQGTFTHAGGALVFGYDFERQAGIISAADVARYDNGFFAHEQYALTPRIFLSAGARLEQSSTFGAKFAPRGAVTFRLPRETFFRLSAALGIQEPSLLDNFAHEAFYVGNPALTPAKTTSYEAGLFRQWFGRRLRTEASLFRNSFRDLIEFDGSVNPATFINVDRSWARGGEISATIRVTGYLNLRGAYTKLYTRVVSSNAGDAGTELVRRPRNSGSVTVSLTPGRWTLIAGGRLVGERQESDFVFFAINRNPGYEYVFASGSWRAAKHIEPFVRIQNVLDESYQEVLGYSALSRNAAGGVRILW